MATQKALFLTGQNGEWVVRDRDIPSVLPGRVVVKNLATALNPVDWKIRARGMFVKEWPAILGMDAAGTIEHVGKGVMHWKKGDRVLYQGQFEQDKHTFQQYSQVPAEVVARLPESISFDAASTIPLALATAALSLYQYKGSDDVPAITPPWLPGGEGKFTGMPVVILGGSSSVGQYAIQLAKLSGFKPIITTASLRNATLLKDLGATDVLDRSSATLAADILSLAKAQIVFDAISEPETQAIGLEVLAPDGVLSVVLLPAVDVEKAKQDKKVIHHTFGSVHPPNLRDFGYAMLASLPRLLEEGKIKPNAYDVLPGGLHAIGDGLKLLEDNKVSAKKLVVRPFESSIE